MGHERVGALPKTKPWEKVVKNIAAFDGTAEDSRKIANQTLDNVRNKFESIQGDLNDKISAILNTDRDKFAREHPAVRFGLATAIPDHSKMDNDLVIETKYLRGSTTPSRASDGMAADLTKYPPTAHILFVVYDPERAISDDQAFRSGFEDKGRCTVQVIR